MNKQSQKSIFYNLICPISKENLILKNKQLDTNGLIKSGELFERNTNKYAIKKWFKR